MTKYLVLYFLVLSVGCGPLIRPKFVLNVTPIQTETLTTKTPDVPAPPPPSVPTPIY